MGYLRRSKARAISIILFSLILFVFSTHRTYAGQCGSNVPSGVVYCIPLTITNFQTAPVVSGTQISVAFSPSSYQRYMGANLQNVEFYNPSSGQVFSSWLEGNPANELAPVSPTTTTALYWVLLPFQIGTSSQTSNVYIGIGSTSTNFYATSGGSVGIAPQLTCSNPSNTLIGCGNNQYGQYDNGAQIFTFYDNFAHGALDANWVIPYSGGSASSSPSNGLFFWQQNNNAYMMWGTKSPIQVTGGYGTGLDVFESNDVNGGRMQIEISNGNTLSSGGSPTDYNWIYQGMGLSWEPDGSLSGCTGCFELFTMDGGAGTGSGPNFWQQASFTPTAMALDWSAACSGGEWENAYWGSYSFHETRTDACNSGNNYIWLMSGTSGASFSNGMFKIQWVKVRNLPPNDIMPTVASGSLALATSVPVPTITISPSSAPYIAGANVLITATCYSSDPCEIQGPTGTYAPGTNPINEIIPITSLPSTGVFTFNAVDQLSPSSTANALLTVFPGLWFSQNPVTYTQYQSGFTENIMMNCGTSTCQLSGPPPAPKASTGLSTSSFSVSALSGSGVYTYTALDQNSLLYTNLQLVILPGITFTQNPTTYANIVTVTALCGSGNQCQLSGPLGTFTGTTATQQTFNTVNIGIGAFNFYATVLSAPQAKQSGTLLVSSPSGVVCNPTSTANSGTCEISNSIIFNTGGYSNALNGGFYQETFGQIPVPVTSSVQSYNNQSAQWLLTCPDQPNPANTIEYISPTSDSRLGGNACQTSSAPMNSLANLNVFITWNGYTSNFVTANIVFNISNIAQLNVQNLAYSGEAYNQSRGIASANISNGYDSYSNIFSGVPPSSQEALWSWNSKITNVGNSLIPGIGTAQLLPSPAMPFSNFYVEYPAGSNCVYPYLYDIGITISTVNNIGVPVPTASSAMSNFLEINNITYNGVNSGTPPGITAPNSLMMSQCLLPNFWGNWHMVGTRGVLNYQGLTETGQCIYQYGSTPYYWTNYGPTSSVYIQSNSVQTTNSPVLPAFTYNFTLPSAYSSIEQNSLSYYNNSYYIYSYHNVQNPGAYIEPFPLRGGSGIFLAANGILSMLSADAFWGGTNYQNGGLPPGLSTQTSKFVIPANATAANVLGLINAQQLGNNASVSNITDPMLFSQASNNNLFVIGSAAIAQSNSVYATQAGWPATCSPGPGHQSPCVWGQSGYYLYDIRLVPPGDYNLSGSTPLLASVNYSSNSLAPSTLQQQYYNKLSSYWSNTTQLQSGSPVIARSFNLTALRLPMQQCTQNQCQGANVPPAWSVPLAMTSDYSGDTFVLGANVVCNPQVQSGYGVVCNQGAGTGFNLLYISSNGVALTTNVVGGPSFSINGNPFMQQLGSDLAVGAQVGQGSNYPTTTQREPAYMAVSPGGQYLYIAEQNLSYVLIYSIGISNVLNVSYVNAINLSYSSKYYNLSINQYLENGGPFNSTGLKQYAHQSLYLNNLANPCYLDYNDTFGTPNQECNGFALKGTVHTPLGIAISGSTLYVLDNWLFAPYADNSGSNQKSSSMLMLRAFYLNGTEIPIHASTISDVIQRVYGLSLTTGYIANKLYPPYGWPISANFTLDNSQFSQNYISYCAYYCNNTPAYTTDPFGINVIYAGYPPIGPQVAANNRFHSGSFYEGPQPISLLSDFNNTVYLGGWSLFEPNLNNQAGETRPPPNACLLPGTYPYTYDSGGGIQISYYQACQLYNELLAVRMNVDNYTKASNASASPNYGCYQTTAGQQCGYMNNNYQANYGLASSPTSYSCYIGMNQSTWDYINGHRSSSTLLPDGTPITPYMYGGAVISSPCTFVDNLSLQAPPFIGTPDAFGYAESRGSPDNYITAPSLSSTFAYSSGGSSGGGSSSQSSSQAPTISVSPGTAILGQNIIVTVTSVCAGTDTCDVEYPLGTPLSSNGNGNLPHATCNPATGGTAICSVNTIDFTSTGTYQFFGKDISGSYSGTWSAANLIIGNALNTNTENALTGTIANTVNGVSVSIPISLVTPSYLKSSVGGALLVPYTYTYTLYQDWCHPGTSHKNCVQTLPAAGANPGCAASVRAPSAQTATYNVFTVEPVYARSALNETVQSGPIIPEYQNWLKYYIANLSDQYLWSPPQIYYNIFTNRIFGEIYINQSVGPRGFSSLIQSGSNYVPGSLILNATHILNYSQVNYLQIAPQGTGFAVYPGFSAEQAIGPAVNPLIVQANPPVAQNASWVVVYNSVGTMTLNGPVFAHDVIVSSATTLVTDGFPIIAANALYIYGTIQGGYPNDGGIYTGNGGSILYSYGGSGGAPGNFVSVGGNTLAPAGNSASPAGKTPTLPSNTQITTNTLQTWAYDITGYLSGAGGGSSSYTSNGGSGSYGIYLQANTLYIQSGTINAAGQNGGLNSGGGGGGVIILAYNAISLSAPTYQYSGGVAGWGGGTGGNGGAGNIMFYRFALANVPITLSRFNNMPIFGADCAASPPLFSISGSPCAYTPYYYNLGPLTFRGSCTGHICPFSATINPLCPYLNMFCGNSALTEQSTPALSALQLFSALKIETITTTADLNLLFDGGILGYNRLNYTYADQFNNIINMPVDVDLANITTISLNDQATINSINPNETTISLSGTAGYYPSIFAAAPSPVPVNSLIYIYYDTSLNFLNTTNSPLSSNPNSILYPNLATNGPQSANALSYYQYAVDCAFGAAGSCTFANPSYTTNPPVGQGPLGAAEANVITFNTQYNSIGECSPQPNSLLLPIGTNTNECNIYGMYGLQSSGKTDQGFTTYCIPYLQNGNGVLTSQLGLVTVLHTDSNGYFSNTFTVCGTGTARLQASYYGYPPGQPISVLQPTLQTTKLAQPTSITPFAYPCPGAVGPCTVVSPTPMVYSQEFNYSITPNQSIVSFPIGTYYLSFGGIPALAALILAIGIGIYMLTKGIMPSRH